ncbi:hypothetical protein HELRODRAFT_170772 [Helobdella robusta]|uniref:Uncharacterized protein n=1 Tax=Helobdella robusta TaxID=6412 RepID=T1F3E8_HELRO|nr:hypothetical protein HELRODRAFT_170772 [Helobdella robusta]ESO06759.1 hypothetical protein HELRODRAFT_170772 [Helobdella robusta]
MLTVRATGLLCLLGVGLGLGTFLLYKLYTRLYLKFSSAVDHSFNASAKTAGETKVLNAETPDSGISSDIQQPQQQQQRHQLTRRRRQQQQDQQDADDNNSTNVPQQWRKRIIDWLAKSSFSLEDTEVDAFLHGDEDGQEEAGDDDDDANRNRRRCRSGNKGASRQHHQQQQHDPMVTSYASAWSSGFISNGENNGPENNLYISDDIDNQDAIVGGYHDDDMMMDGIDEVSENDDDIAHHAKHGCHHHSPTSEGNRRQRPLSSRTTSSKSSDLADGEGWVGGGRRVLRRNCYSFTSHKSGDSSLYEYRESLVSKGYSVDLGENLDDVVLPDDQVNMMMDDAGSQQDELCDARGLVKHGAVDHMDQLQYELMKIRMDIDCMNEKFDHLYQGTEVRLYINGYDYNLNDALEDGDYGLIR